MTLIFHRLTNWIILVLLLFSSADPLWDQHITLINYKVTVLLIEKMVTVISKSNKTLDIFSYDTIKTGKGKVGILFIDDTRVDVTEHSKLVIDEFIYDPNTQTGRTIFKSITWSQYDMHQVQIAKNSAQNITIKTPTTTIGVRGTDFSMTIDELGSSTIILLPSCDVK